MYSCGKTTHCIFDKTGTLTTDQMLPYGVVNAATTAEGNKGNVVKPLEPVVAAKGTVSMVSVPAIPSFMLMVQALWGPYKPALKGIGWRYNTATSTATPGDWQSVKLHWIKLRKNCRHGQMIKDMKRKELLQATMKDRKTAGERAQGCKDHQQTFASAQAHVCRCQD